MIYDEKLTKIVPHERQFRFQQLEFNTFIHFTVNTFTDKEWGDGMESPSIFNPKRLDPEKYSYKTNQNKDYRLQNRAYPCILGNL